MHDTWRETLCHCALLVASLKSVRIVVFNQPDKRGRPPLGHMLIFLVYIRLSVSSFYDSFPLFLTGNAPMHPQSDKLSRLLFFIGFFSKLDIIFSLFLRYYYNYPLLIFYYYLTIFYSLLSIRESRRNVCILVQLKTVGNSRGYVFNARGEIDLISK